MQSLTILGSTGSIGVQALEIVAAHPERFTVFALTAHRNIDKLFQQCQQFKPVYAVMADAASAKQLSQRLNEAKLNTEVLFGEKALSEVASANEVDTILSAIVGAAALLSTFSAIRTGKKILLANKESLVMAGELMMSALSQYNAVLLPIDSEHNAVFQCLPKQYLPGQGRPVDVHSIILTASGGPFRLTPIDQLSKMTPQQAIAHPNWSMGAKISVDSATMMNKGLEVIEARWLFNLLPTEIEVLIHPQSLVHAFVRYEDGSVLSHSAPPNMRIPIAHVLAWPERIASGVAPMDCQKMSNTEFYRPDMQRYPCLKLAYEALDVGGTAPTILNAANEIAVDQFLSEKLRFDQISIVVEKTLEQMSVQYESNLEAILSIDQEARRQSVEIISKM